MIVYEVRMSVRAEILDAFRTWLEGHVREVLAAGRFDGAELLREDDATGAVLVARYHLDSRETLAAYLRDHAPALRADAVARFGDRFVATRRVHELVRTFP